MPRAERQTFTAYRTSPYNLDEASKRTRRDNSQDTWSSLFLKYIPRWLRSWHSSSSPPASPSLSTMQIQGSGILPRTAVVDTSSTIYVYPQHEEIDDFPYDWHTAFAEPHCIQPVPGGSTQKESTSNRPSATSSLSYETRTPARSALHRLDTGSPLATAYPAPYYSPSTSPATPQQPSAQDGPLAQGTSSASQPSQQDLVYHLATQQISIRRRTKGKTKSLSVDKSLYQFNLTASSSSFKLTAPPPTVEERHNVKAGDVHMHLSGAELEDMVLQAWVYTCDSSWTPAGEGFQHPRVELSNRYLHFMYSKLYRLPRARWLLKQSVTKRKRCSKSLWWEPGGRRIDIWTPDQPEM